ncbi:hypothetical protein KUCAC02_027284 [Chaenocephalus aceratus]|uniref:Uncharacterized protein n=1 Tax=Chaenocephalus aceratus TaxID=36190 RepID=A0ACB9W4Q5_CHAAC|nr:hypothetical protein KUCAC02_027284 [Chaenocephalus aceratus]
MGTFQDEDLDWGDKSGDTRQTQPPKYEETETKSSGRKCPTCCLKTRNCLMSGECGRCLQISSVVAMCGMCLRIFISSHQSGLLPSSIITMETSLNSDGLKALMHFKHARCASAEASTGSSLDGSLVQWSCGK